MKSLGNWRTNAQAILLVDATSSGLFGEELATSDWLRGTGKDLQICLRGEVYEEDGQPATNLEITCRMNGADSAQQLQPTIDGHRFEVWLPVNASRWYSGWLKAASTRSNHVAYKKLILYELRQAAIDGVKLTLRPPTRQ